MKLTKDEYDELVRLSYILGSATLEQKNRWVELYTKFIYCDAGHIMGIERMDYPTKPCFCCETRKAIARADEIIRHAEAGTLKEFFEKERLVPPA